MIVGGASATAVTAHHQSVADGVRADAETWWYGEKFAEYVVVAAVEQTVAGTNYTFKIRIGSGQGILLRVFEGLDGKSSVHGLEKVAIDVAPRMIQESPKPVRPPAAPAAGKPAVTSFPALKPAEYTDDAAKPTPLPPGKKRTAQLKAMVAAAWKKLPEKPAPKGRTRNLEALLEALIGRQSEPPELFIFRRHVDDAVGALKTEALKAEAGTLGWTQEIIVKACVAADAELEKAGAPFYTAAAAEKRDKHETKVRKARFSEVSGHWHFFRAGNAVLLVLALLLLAAGVVELLTLNIYAEMPATVGFCAALALLAFLGVVGSARLKRELMEDDDGRETTAQRATEVYFWSMV